MKVKNVDLEAELDCIEIDGACILHVSEALSVGIHPDAPPFPEGGLHIFLPDTLDAEMGELYCHVLTINKLFAHSTLAASPANLKHIVHS